MPDTVPSSFSLWLEEALTGWILPVGALVLAGLAWGLYQAGFVPEGPAGAAIAAVVAAVLGLYLVRPLLGPAVEAPVRAAGLAVAAAAFLLCLLPPVNAVLPGAAVAEGELAQRGDAVALPAGTAGNVRVLVHAPLPPGGTPEVQFRLGAGAGAMMGHVERTVSFGRAGRAGRTTVLHDRNETWVHGAVAAGAPLTLENLTGQVAGPLHVTVVREWATPGLLWLLAFLVVAAAGVVEVRLGKGNLGALAGIAVAYGLLVAGNATPATAVGTSLGGVLLGGLTGAAGGAIIALVAKASPWKPPAPAKAPVEAEAPAGKPRRGKRARAS
jgi:hypothetical protein